MPIPKGLKFEDRIAPYVHPKKGAGHLFFCQRKGHSASPIFVVGFKSDAKEFRAAHDTAFHNAIFRHLGFEPAKNVTIDQLCREWKRHVSQLEIEGKRHPKTTAHYYGCCDYIERGMREVGVRTVRDIDPSAISRFSRWFSRHSASQGAYIVKTLHALRSMIRWKGLPVDWKIPHDEIQAKRQIKRDLDSDTIARLIAAMPAGSLEEAIAWLKARTGARDVEIRDAVPEEFDLERGIFAPMLHSKRKQKRHVYVLTEDAIAVTRPFIDAAKKGQPIFTMEGRKLRQESLRRRLVAASKKAKIVPPVRSLAPIRAEIITIVTDERSITAAAKFIGHEDPRTSRAWYYKDKITQKKLEEKRRIAEIVAKAIPLRKTA